MFWLVCCMCQKHNFGLGRLFRHLTTLKLRYKNPLPFKHGFKSLMFNFIRFIIYIIMKQFQSTSPLVLAGWTKRIYHWIVIKKPNANSNNFCKKRRLCIYRMLAYKRRNNIQYLELEQRLATPQKRGFLKIYIHIHICNLLHSLSKFPAI